MFKRMYLEITNVCNLRCAFCPGTQRPRRFMTPEEFRQLAARLRPYGTYLMLHVMGEPLLHPQLAELLDIAGELDFRVCLVTNGTLLPRQLPTLEGVWQAAQRLSSRGVLCALRLWNGGGLDRRNGEILSFLSEKLGRDVTALPTDRLGNRRLGEGLFLEPGERFDWPDPAAPDSGTEFCHGLRSQIAVLCDGTVVPCCLDSEGRLALGNLHRQELAEILASPRATAMAAGFSRRQPSEELCRRCGYAARFSR